MMLRVLRTVCLVAWVCGCSNEVPCVWDTMPTDAQSARADRELQTPGLVLTCGTDTFPVGAHYRNNVSSEVELSSLEIHMVPQGYPDNYSVSFPATWPDGSYDLSDLGFVADRATTASFSFTRSHDVPFVDVPDPKPRVYESSLDFELDMQIIDTGCRLSTTETVHVVQSGPVKACARGTVGASH